MTREYYAAHREELRRKQKERYRDDTEYRHMRMAKSKAYRKRNLKAVREREKISRLLNRDKVVDPSTIAIRNSHQRDRRASPEAKAKARARRATPEAKAKAHEYYLKNRERILSTQKLWYAKVLADPEAIARRQVVQNSYYSRNKEKWRESDAKKDPAKVREYKRRYQISHPEIENAKTMRRLARIRFGTAEEDRPAIVAFYRHLKTAARLACAYCGRDIPKGRDRHADHVVPLSKGGRHCVGNLVPSCGPCNRRKSDKIWEPVHFSDEDRRRCLPGTLAA